ncbi:hypothetical protein C8F04DRAFT_144275 [Mycena alexandri]|uniref:DUF6533 domain-containing protein n=1 Tax=Mycena alexandri TaxID=1745969 RepID=A0AAD6XDR2_9AGAR|nr:hypothetical protein C8F04DRAFT_144275 [Mycena alexandri]
MLAFLYWDHFISFDDEVRFLWKKANTRSTYYFFVNRYLAFFGDLVITLLLLVNQCVVCVLLTLRIYALYGLDKRVYIGLLGFGVILLGISCWALIGRSGVPEPNTVGCHIAISQNLGAYFAVPWEALFLYDVVIFLALFYKSLQTRAESPLMWRRTPILGLLIRDGAIYFAIMACVNLANIVTYFIAEPLLRGCLSTLCSCMSVTLTSRLMLNMHSLDRLGIFSTTAHLTRPDGSSSDVEIGPPNIASGSYN